MDKLSFKAAANMRSTMAPGIAKAGTDGDFKKTLGGGPLRVNLQNVVLEGLLYKKESLLKLNKQYLFYLEKRDDLT